MSDAASATLGLSRFLLKLCRVFNVIIAASFFALLIFSFTAEHLFVDYYRKNMPEADVGLLIPTLRAMVLVGAPMFALVHVLLTRILDMTETVRTGDPFVPENAVRLRAVAWCLLLIQLLHMCFVFLVHRLKAAHVNMDIDVSLAGWLAVLLTFVLAGVFEHGARVRSDLQAMI